MVNLPSCFALRMPCLHPLWLELQAGHHACPGFAEGSQDPNPGSYACAARALTIEQSLQPYLMGYIVTTAEQSLSPIWDTL